MKLVVGLVVLGFAGVFAQESNRLLPLPITAVRISDKFWAPRVETNRTRTLETVRQRLIEAGNIENLKIAAGKSQAKYRGPFWADSDVYKWIEGAAYSLVLHRDPDLEAKVDEVIAYIAAAQQRDGYINTYFQLVQPEARWTFEAFGHEMYNAGHMFEGAVAHYEATGKRTFLEVAIKNADYIDGVFGPGKREGQPGHQVIELALVKLYRATGEKRYLKLAQFFLDERGQKPSLFEKEYERLDPNPRFEFLGRMIGYRTLYDELFHRSTGKINTEYSQDHLPVRQQDKVVGHAVRAMYMYAGMADVAAETGDQAMMAALYRLYGDLTTKRIYVTGAMGASGSNEGFTTDFDLPNERAYGETCASIGLILWTQRMLGLTGDGQYADAMEQSLYNAFPAGVSLAGDLFFYTNPLYSSGKTQRRQWFSVPCCPTNVVRILPSLGKYIYSQGQDALWVNLYVQGSATADVGNGKKLTIEQQSDYPWSGVARIKITDTPGSPYGLNLRVPGWTQRTTFSVNGKPEQPAIDKGYAKLRRQWKTGDTVEVTLSMDVQRIQANPRVAEDRGKVALRRGPVIYCLEQVDQQQDLDRFVLPMSSKLESRFDATLLGGVTTLTGTAKLRPEITWSDRLYQTAPAELTGTAPVRAVPYCTWNNRGAGKMAVWVDAAH